MHTSSYAIEEHRHRFSAWAACRAASVKNSRFSVSAGKDILEKCGFDSEFNIDCIAKSADAFDIQHRKWRESIIAEAANETHGLKLSHGVAAKLINCYLKALVICGGHDRSKLAAYIHPPIDDILLKTLAKKGNAEKCLSSKWRALRKRRWSKFTSADYKEAITTAREELSGKPLWMIEEYWRGYQ